MDGRTHQIESVTKTIEQKLLALIETPLTEEQLQKMLGAEFGVFRRTDHVAFAAEYLIANPYFRDRSVGPPSDKCDVHIYRRLGHIVVNPHKEANTAALVETYVHPDPSAVAIDPDGHGPAINASETTLSQFLQRLTRSPQGHPFAYYLIHGPRGAGKTFLQNHILSKYSRELDGQRIVWLRINLTEETFYEDDLEGLIYAQAAKVVFRYYDPASHHFQSRLDAEKITVDVDAIVQELLDDRLLGRRDHSAIINQVLEMRRVFRTEGLKDDSEDRKLSPTWVSGAVAAHLWRSVTKLGFRFVVVLDGLDVLEATPAAHKRFARLRTQIGKLVAADEKPSCALVVCCRTSTFDREFNDLGTDTFGFRPVREVYRVAPAPIGQVLEKRLVYLTKEIASLNLRPGWGVQEWSRHFGAYRSFLTRSSLNVRSVLEEYDRILGENVRAKTQMLQYEYYEFLRKEVKGRVYHILEAIMKGGRRFPLAPYTYKAQSDETIERHVSEGAGNFDSRFLPTLWRCASPILSVAARATSQESLNESLSQLSAGFRLLQIIYAAQAVLEEPRITVGELCRIMDDTFGVGQGITIRFIEEWVEYQLIELGNDHVDSLADVKGRALLENRVNALPKLDALCRLFVLDMTYLNLAAMRIPLNESAFHAASLLSAAQLQNLDFVCPYFRCAAQDASGDPIADWIKAKLLNAAALARIVKAVDARQGDLINMKKGLALPPRLRLVLRRALEDGLLSRGVAMKATIVEAVGPVLHGLADSPDVQTIYLEIEQAIELYTERWAIRV